MNRFGKEEEQALLDVIRSADKTLSFYSFSYKAEGGQVHAFEKEFARWLGRKHCVAVNSGTSALMVAIKALSVKTDPILGKNDCLERTSENIALPAYTFVADAEAIVASGNRPCFQDIDEKDYCIKPDTQLPLNIIVHTLGNVCPPERFERRIPYDLEYKVIEDCAQSLNAKWNGKKAGRLGEISIFSGQGTKNLGAGEAGWLCMDNEELYERACAIRNHASYYKYTHPNKKYPYLCNMVGYNLRMTELQACILRVQLQKFDSFYRNFERNAKLIFDLLPSGIDRPYYPKKCQPAYFILGCMYRGKHRDKFLEKLWNERKKKKMLFSVKIPDIPGSNQPPSYSIGSGYKHLLHELPLYQKYKRETPNADFVRNNVVWFDIHRWSEEERVKKNMEIVNRVYKEIEG